MPVASQPVGPGMQFTLIERCSGAPCQTVVVANGLIARDSHQLFQQTTRGLPAGTTVELNSSGGDLLGALRLGEAIRQASHHTRIASREEGPGMGDLLKSFGLGSAGPDTRKKMGQECLSACVFAFMGGSRRLIDPESRVGFQAIQTGGDERLKNARQALTKYVDQMGVDRRILDLALNSEAKSLLLIDNATARKWTLDNRDLNTNYSTWRLQATQQGTLVGFVTERMANGLGTVTLGISRIQSDYRLLIHVRPAGPSGFSSEQRTALSGSSPRFTLSGQPWAPPVYKPWSPAGEGLQLWLSIEESDLDRINELLELNLRLETNSSTSGLGQSLGFGTRGLSRIVQALKRTGGDRR